MIFGFSLIELLLIFISAGFIISTSVAYVQKQRRVTIYKVLLTYLIWGGVVTLILFPGITYDLAKLMGVSSNLNAIIFLGFVLTFFIIFRLLNIVSRIESTVTDLVREIAIKEGIRK